LANKRKSAFDIARIQLG